MSNILVVDDSQSMRQVIIITLQDSGHETFEAGNGKDALALAKTNKFDAIISDLNMPEMDGISLVTELRALRNYKYTPIILLTTEKKREFIDAGKKAGANGWMVKPFIPEELIKAVNRIVQ